MKMILLVFQSNNLYFLAVCYELMAISLLFVERTKQHILDPGARVCVHTVYVFEGRVFV